MNSEASGTEGITISFEWDSFLPGSLFLLP